MSPRKDKSPKKSSETNEEQQQHIINKGLSNNKPLKSNVAKAETSVFKKKDLKSILRNEYSYISNYFNILDVASLNHGKLYI